MLYLNDPALVRRVLLADGWHYVNDEGLRVTDRGVSWALGAATHPVADVAIASVRIYAAKADVLAVEEWAPEPMPVDGLDFDRRPPTPPAP